MLCSLRRREARNRRRIPPVYLLPAVLLLAWSVSAYGQGGGTPDVQVSYGTIGLQGLTTFAPSSLYRPIDMLTVRPGADALGMGSAHLAAATGAMALGWNPAGLATLERTAVAFDGLSLSSSGKVGDFPDSFFVPQSPPFLISFYDVNRKGGFRANYLAVGTPLLRRGSIRAVGGLAWRRFADLTVPEETVSELLTPQISGFPLVLAFDRSERGGVDALTPGLALQLGPRLAVGASYNVLDGFTRATTDIRLTIVGSPLRGGGQTKMKYSGSVPEVGVRLTPTDRIQLAARFMPSFQLKARHGSYYSTSINGPGQPRFTSRALIADYDLKVPAALSMGLALRPIQRLLLAADLASQPWSEARAVYKQPIVSILDARGEKLPLADVSVVSVGAEYMLKEFRWVRIPVRVGFRTAPQGFRQISPADLKIVTLPGTTTRIGISNGTFNGKEVKANALSFGSSLLTKGIDYHLGIETVSYTFEKWFFDAPFDPLVNPDGARVTTDRSVTTIRISADYSF